MSQLSAITTEAPSAAPPARRGRPLLAWLVILAAVAFILWRYSTVSPKEKERYDLVTMRLQGRYLIGVAELEERYLGSKKSAREQLYEEAQKNLNRGTYPQRLRFVVLAGELKGPNESREQLQEIDQKYRFHCGNPSPEDEATARLLDHLYAVRAEDANAVASLPEDEQQKLRQRLDWFGDLALAPRDGDDQVAREAVLAQAVRTVWALLGVGIFMLALFLIGLVFLVTLGVLYFLGHLQSGLKPGSPHHGIYAETFALYMLLYLGLSLAARSAIRWLTLEKGTLALSGLAALGSLAALGWPVLRGIPWRQVRQDIGWHADRRPKLAPLLGAGSYALALPMLVLGGILFFILTTMRDRLGWGPDEFGPSNAPGHPIVFWVSRAGWWIWLEVLFVASVVAPIVEETMFRGVLYRHLRAASSRWWPALSVLFSAVVASFVFAVIHPQGFLAVPLLMALALAFTLIREWRGTLLPSMIAHGINNAVATLLLFLMS
ncbi:MAG TPA: CPBP family intramembrane glutamic endopeptidase [Gemmataceae bacterium]|nr:CPBP family intramembrane glutamic endopeptidase [Gemmataceae bacterium]